MGYQSVFRWALAHQCCLQCSSLSSMLKARWKGNAPAASAKPEALSEGQIRSFRIVKLDAEARKIDVELA